MNHYQIIGALILAIFCIGVIFAMRKVDMSWGEIAMIWGGSVVCGAVLITAVKMLGGEAPW